MHKDDEGGAGASPPRATLLAASVDFTDRVELVEYADGSVGIRINDEALDGYKWDASRTEDGIRIYLRMVKRN